MMMRQEVFIRESAVVCAAGNTIEEAASALLASGSTDSHKTFPFGSETLTRQYYVLDSQTAEGAFYTKLEGVIGSLIERAGLNLRELEECALYMGSTSMNLTAWEGIVKNPSKTDANISMDGYGEIGRKLAERFGIGGEVLLFSTACTSSANGLLEACREIRIGAMKRAIVVGFEFYNELTVCGFEAMGLLSKEGCKPFDANRSGMVLGEGCAAVLLDTLPPSTGGRLRMLGGSNRSDVHSITSHNVDGSIIAHTLRDALNDAGVAAEAITHIKAHATGSTHNDLAEGRGIRDVFALLPEIFVLKSAIGHTLGACGALELALLDGLLREGFIPKTKGFETLDPEVQIVPSAKESPLGEGYCMLNHFGFAGSGVALVVHFTQGENG